MAVILGLVGKKHLEEVQGLTHSQASLEKTKAVFSRGTDGEVPVVPAATPAAKPVAKPVATPSATPPVTPAGTPAAKPAAGPAA